MKELLSIVIPCFNEQESLPIFYQTITPILKELSLDYELVFVDDGSKDNTPKILKELANNDKKVKYVIFSRNFGKEGAIYAGLNNAMGDYVAVMDVDLQDPPELLSDMLKIIKEEDYDCVATRRVTRKGEPKIRSWFARKFYKLINKWSQVEIVDGARDYRLMKRNMVDAILEMKEVNRFSKGIFSFVGFKTKWLEYENIQRVAGTTKWNFRKLFVYALEGILSFTLAPLYFIIKCGLTLISLDFLAAIILLIVSLCLKRNLFLSWVIILLVMILLCSLILISLGIMAIYQAKMYNEIKNRPIYIIKERNTDKDL